MPSFPNRFTANRRATRSRRRGQTLAEFAIVTVVLYLLVGGILTFGYAIYAAQGLQQAADVAAREISRTPLPANITLDNDGNGVPDDGVLFGNANSFPSELGDVRNRVFDEHYLVLIVDDPNDQSRNFHGFGSLDELIGSLPILNQQLFPLMISDFVEGILVIRYPGQVIRDTDASDDPGAPAASGYLVRIPLTNGGSVPVVEEIDTEAHPQDQDGPATSPSDNHDPMRLDSPHRGIVALRINYPWHSPFLSGGDRNNNSAPVLTDGSTGLSLGNVIDEKTGQPTGLGPYTGAQGFGRQIAVAEEVRPFRKLISAQAIYRREVFTP